MGSGRISGTDDRREILHTHDVRPEVLGVTPASRENFEFAGDPSAAWGRQAAPTRSGVLVFLRGGSRRKHQRQMTPLLRAEASLGVMASPIWMGQDLYRMLSNAMRLGRAPSLSWIDADGAFGRAGRKG